MILQKALPTLCRWLERKFWKLLRQGLGESGEASLLHWQVNCSWLTPMYSRKERGLPSQRGVQGVICVIHIVIQDVYNARVNTHWVILCMNDCEAMLPRSYFMETTGSWAHLMKELSHCQDYALAFAASSHPTISQLCHSCCGAITWPVIHSWGSHLLFLDKKKPRLIWATNPH